MNINFKEFFKVGEQLGWRIGETPIVNYGRVLPCTVTEVLEGHAIAKTKDGIILWIDNDNLYQFEWEVK